MADASSQADPPGAVARIIRTRDDIAVFFRRGLQTLDGQLTPGARVECENQVPFMISRVIRWHIERVALGSASASQVMSVIAALKRRHYVDGHHQNGGKSASPHTRYYVTFLCDELVFSGRVPDAPCRAPSEAKPRWRRTYMLGVNDEREFRIRPRLEGGIRIQGLVA